MTNPFATMTVEQLSAHVTANRVEDEEEASAALKRLSHLAAARQSHPLVSLTLTMLAEMPSSAAVTYADDLEADASLEQDDATAAILFCAVAILRAIEEA